MSKQLHRYYLQQLGIESWVRCNKNKQKLMIIGEALGVDDNQKGSLLIGKVGVLLNKMLSSIDVSYDDVYFANALRFQPQHDNLSQTIAMVRPTVILALGRAAWELFLKNKSELNPLRGQLYDHEGTPVVISCHPDDLLQNPADKKNAYHDLLMVKSMISTS